MPNYRAAEQQQPKREWDDATLARISDYNVRVAEEALRQKAIAAGAE